MRSYGVCRDDALIKEAGQDAAPFASYKVVLQSVDCHARAHN